MIVGNNKQSPDPLKSKNNWKKNTKNNNNSSSNNNGSFAYSVPNLHENI